MVCPGNMFDKFDVVPQKLELQTILRTRLANRAEVSSARRFMREARDRIEETLMAGREANRTSTAQHS
jgi:hypothetical protein